MGYFANSIISSPAGCVKSWALFHFLNFECFSILDAARKNSFRLLRFLLKLHTGKRQDLDLVLIQAIKAGHVESTLVLLDAGADANTRDAYENTPLLLASEMGHEPLVRVLLKRGAQVREWWGWVVCGERERGRERERAIERHTETQTEDRDTHRQRETHTQRHRQREAHTQTQTEDRERFRVI
jgi:hypothetical protein